MRDASRAGRRERVKLAEARSASLDNGGRPWLEQDEIVSFVPGEDSVRFVLTGVNRPVSRTDEGLQLGGQPRRGQHPRRHGGTNCNCDSPVSHGVDGQHLQVMPAWRAELWKLWLLSYLSGIMQSFAIREIDRCWGGR